MLKFASVLFLSSYFFITEQVSASTYDLGIISMFRNGSPYLKEWVEYHRLAGVDHFWLYDNGSTDDSVAVLKPYLTGASKQEHSDNCVGKSIVRPKHVDISAVWNVHHFTLLPKAFYVNGIGQFLPFSGVDLCLDGVHHGNYIRINRHGSSLGNSIG